MISNNAGIDELGLGQLLKTRQIRKMISSYVGENKEFERQYLTGEIEIEFNPQGTLAERIRAGGAGIYGFYTRTGAGTQVAEGKETRVVDGDTYVLETGLTADLAIVKAWKGDTEGNLVYRKTARNFNPMMATAGRVTVAEVEQLVEVGTLDPDQIHTPGIFVQRIVQGTDYQQADRTAHRAQAEQPMPWSREQLAERAARELRDGFYVNLGIGIPTLVANYIPAGMKVVLQSENGMLGMGPFPYEGEEDPDLINAGKQTITELPSLLVFFVGRQLRHDSRRAYQSVGARRHGSVRARGSRQLDGAGQDGQGHGRRHGPGGRRARVIVLMEHVARDGSPKFKPSCELPLTGAGVVDMLITDLAVFSRHEPQAGIRTDRAGPGRDRGRRCAASAPRRSSARRWA